MRTHRKNNMCGTARVQRSSSIQVAEIPISVYVSRLSKNTTTQDIIKYINEMDQECINVQLLTQKHETSFSSFKVLVPRAKLEIFLKNDFWPEGVKFRVFRERATIAKTAVISA